MVGKLFRRMIGRLEAPQCIQLEMLKWPTWKPEMKIHKNLHTKNKLGGVNENSQEYAQVANLEVYMKIHKNMLNWPTWKPK